MGMGTGFDLPKDFEGSVSYLAWQCDCGEDITLREGESFACTGCSRWYEWDFYFPDWGAK